MSLGSGHVWTDKRSEGGLLGIECTRCGKRQNYPLAFFDSMRSRPRRGKLCRFKMRVPTGRRPLGTCSAGTHTAQRRAKGEAEIRATFDLFE